MAKRKNNKNLAPEVEHPRYGLGPGVSRYKGPELEEWRLGRAFNALKIYPKTALKADQAFQKNSYGKYDYYVDQLLRCEGCKRAFVYFAEEHQFRVEHCKRYHRAFAMHCPDCRLARGLAKQARRDYDAFAARLNRGRRAGVPDDQYSHDDWLEFAGFALAALDGGTLGLHGKISWLLSKLERLSEEDPGRFAPLAQRLRDHFTAAEAAKERRRLEFEQKYADRNIGRTPDGEAIYQF